MDYLMKIASLRKWRMPLLIALCVFAQYAFASQLSLEHLVSVLPSQPASVELAGSRHIDVDAAGIWLYKGNDRRLLQAGGRRSATVTQLPTGKVLIWGGVSAAGHIERMGILFDPETESLESTSDLPITPRAGHTATVLTDGRLFIEGGLTDSGATTSAELWNVRTLRIDERVDEPAPRFGAHAYLNAAGSVVIEGGRKASGGGDQVNGCITFDPYSRRFAPVNCKAPAEGLSPLRVVESVPSDGLHNVAYDTWVSVQFSEPVESGTLNDRSVTLLGPNGPNHIRIVAAEQGRLAFLLPDRDLLPGTQYTVFLDGVTSGAGRSLAFTTIAFSTRAVDGAAGTSNDVAASSSTSSGTIQTNSPQIAGAQDNSTSPVVMNLHTGSAGAIAAAKAKCVSTQGIHGYVFCRQAGSVEGGVFSPGADNIKARWRVNNPLPELVTEAKLAKALPAGATSVFGTVRRIDDQPLSNVSVTIGDSTARTDSEGRFVVRNAPAGKQILSVNGGTANHDGEEYGQFVVVLHIQPGKANAVPHNLFVPRITLLDKVSLPSPTVAETVITHPSIPGFEIHIPAGAVLRDRHGNIVTQLAIVPLPTDRSPVPTPGNFPVYYSVQPEGVTVDGLTVESGAGMRVVYPNYSEQTAARNALFWYYDTDHDGWTVYSSGHISDDQNKLIPDSRVGAPRIMPNGAYLDGKSGPNKTCHSGDPVDCATGDFFDESDDLTLNDMGRTAFHRTYVSNDNVVRAFGYGATHAFDIHLSNPSGTCQGFTDATFGNEIDAVLGDGTSYKFFSAVGSTPGNATFVHSGTTSALYGATINLKSSEKLVLQLRDGKQYWLTALCPQRLERIVDRFGNATLFTYTAGLLSQVTFPSGRSFSLAYNGHNEVSRVTDNSGRFVTYAYDGSDNLYIVTFPDSKTEIYTYDTNHNMLTVTDPRGSTMVTNHYDANKRVDQQTYPDGHIFQFVYTLNGSGKVVATDTTDESNNKKHKTFDNAGFILTATRAPGTSFAQTTTLVRGQDELVTSQTDALGRVTNTVYDSVGNVRSQTLLAGTSAAVSYSYTYTPDFNQLASATDPLGHTTSYGYTNGCMTSVADALGHTTSVICDSAGRPLSITDALGHSTTMTYIGNDLHTITDALNRTTTLTTDALGRVTAVSDLLGRQVRTVYDSNGRVSQTIDALNQTTNYLYDENGNLLRVTDPNNGVTQYGYDPRNRKTSRTDALNHSESWTYYGVGNVHTYVDRKSQQTTYAYDALNRPSLVTYADSSTITPTFDAGNRLTSVVDSVSGTITRSYDGMDRLVEETTDHGIVAYSYDAGGNRTSMITPPDPSVTVCVPGIPCGLTTSYDYDDADRLLSISQDSGDTIGFKYDAANRRAIMFYPNGIQTDYIYDNADEIVDLSFKLSQMGACPPSCSPNLAEISYTYDAAGQRISQTGGFGSELLPTPSSGSNTFDLNNKQTLWNGYTFGYDLNGDPTSSADTSPAANYTFDARHRLTAITQGSSTIATFTYDAFNRRISKTINGGRETDYVYDGLNVVQEAGYSSANLLTGLGIDERYARDDADIGRTYFLTDALGSTVALTDSDGTVQQTYSYEPYGEVSATGSSANPYQYTGRENDDTGLYYYRARYYSPALKRFISEDPIGLAAGPNEYAYVGDKPLSQTDPHGLQAQGALVLCVAGGPANPACDAAVVVNVCLAVGTALVLTSDSAPAPDCKQVKKQCIEQCSDSSLPTGDNGFKFWNCLNKCMADNGCEGK
jgi:RHS repeat-associated protein